MSDNWKQPDSPPPPLFLGKKERDLVKQVNDELIERVIGQTILYYPLSVEHSDYHPIYGEAINKVFADPVKVNVLVEWAGFETKTTNLGVDRTSSITVHFHKRRLQEDQDLYVTEGDFVLYGDEFFEITTINEPKQMFGQITQRIEISVKCVKARPGEFDNG
jgi:hypothetical protein